MKDAILALHFKHAERVRIDLPTPSMESAEDGETVIEREYEIYGTVEDVSVLKGKAERTEVQEQWGLPTDKGNIRVRRSQDSAGTRYTMTIKIKKGDGNLENEMEVSQETFEIFKSMVKEGLNKTRYVIPVVGEDDLKLEVDVFTGPEGISNTVKIDLEIPEGRTIDSVAIPFKMTDTRVIQPGNKSSEDLAYVKELFATQYNIKQ